MDGPDLLLTLACLAGAAVVLVLGTGAAVGQWRAMARPKRMTDAEVRRRFPAVAERIKGRCPR